MPRRPKGTGIHSPPIDPVQESIFAPHGNDMPPIPKGLGTRKRNRVKVILKENPYLTSGNVQAVVRLVELYFHFEDLTAEIAKEGVSVYDSKAGHSIPNPLIRAQMDVQSKLIAQERHLAISIPTRREQVEKKDRNPRTGASQRAKGAPTLRIA